MRGPRQGQQQRRPQDREHRDRDQHRPSPARVQDHRRQQDHHEREEPPEDVRVEEHRVDREVRVQLVGGDQLRVQEDRLGLVLDEPDQREQHRQPGEQREAAPRQPLRPVESAQQAVGERERHVEEHHLLERGRELRRVGRLERVQDHVAGEQPLEPPDGAVAGRASAGAGGARSQVAWTRWRPPPQRGHDERQRAGGDDEVQRHEQVRGDAAGLDRNPERERHDHGAGEHRRALGDEQRRRAHRRERDQRADRGHQRVAMDDPELRRVPDVAEQQDRERARARRASPAPGRACRGAA